ncbi:unnamed protein product [Lactuca virosa]|uniref:PPPDE domain-containing protein n=1 Tax=Lactuca virosa TaxID=75947 RepID=A0AAU9LSN3_9ASTR|nr:unnamed protein product [Lactuca virosa]
MAEEGHKVSLHVYDLSHGLARQLSMSFLGKTIEAIWHTGVVVYGREYYYGRGIQEVVAGTAPYGTPMRVVDLGNNIPDYILNLPNEVTSSPMGALIMPMIQNLETTLRAGAVPQAPQFRQSPVTNQLNWSTETESSKIQASKEQTSGKDEDAKPNVDPLGDARSKLQEEIGMEFAAIMVTGTFRASEAAALATKKVMQKYGHINMNAAQS